jgi:hypothetical protein
VTISVIELHEAAHVVAARRLGVEVVRIVTDPGDPHVTTKHRRGGSTADQIATLEKLAVIDLAGAAVEPDASAAISDEQNARDRCERIVRLQHGLAADAQLAVLQRAEAAALWRRLLVRASDLVNANMLAIMQEAAALAAGQMGDSLLRGGGRFTGPEHDDFRAVRL